MGSTAENSAHPNETRPRTRAASSCLAGAIVIALLAAGCGTSSPTRTASSPTGRALAFSKCMRARGVADFPDPGVTPSGPANMIGGVVIPAGTESQSPAFQAAQHSCLSLLSAMLSRHGRPPITAALKTKLIAHAQCMRTHGVPTYRDPSFPASGGIMVTDAGSDPESPAYMRAQSLCGSEVANGGQSPPTRSR